MDSDIHYLSYDPDEIWIEANKAYLDAGGDILYPGDEKEILLRSVQAIVTQMFAGVDVALRMATLRFAVGEYLDIYGEDKRNCTRIPAKAAASTVEICFQASGTARTLPAGTALTADGKLFYLLTEDISQTGSIQTIRASVICKESGSVGNGLLNGTQIQFAIPNPAVTSIYAVENAHGGQDEEDDETYRERIRQSAQNSVTTGTSGSYEAIALSVSSEIIDARNIQVSPGKVCTYMIFKEGANTDTLIADVLAAQSPADKRPNTDHVTAAVAEAIPYTLKVSYTLDAETNATTQAVADAVAEYTSWQNNKLGRAFDPDKLRVLMYGAGATRVVIAEESRFNGNNAIYTTIEKHQHCSGTVIATQNDE